MKELREYGNIQSAISYFRGFKLNRNCRGLDIGTRFGTFINELNKLGYHNFSGIDIDDWAIEEGRRHYPHLSPKLLVYDGFQIPFDENTFDVITAFDIFEHVPNLPSYLIEVHRVTKKGGILIFQTPNKYINIPWSIITKKSLNYSKFHCSLQTKNSLYKILINAGFGDIIIEKHTINTKYNRSKVRKVFGVLGPLFLDILDRMPLLFYPNFLGVWL